MTSRAGTILAAALTAVVLTAVAHGQVRGPRPASPPRTTPAAATASEPADARKVPFRPGETLTYDVTWSSYLTAGVATLTIKDMRPSEGSTAYYIVGEGKPIGLVASLYSLYYKVDTLLDTRSLLPQRGSVYTQEGSRRRTKVTRFDHAALRAEYELRAATVTKSSTGLPRYSQDVLSAIYALRAVPLKANTAFTMPVCDSGKLYRVRFAIGNIETVRGSSGALAAFRITPTITDSNGRTVGRPIRLWMSADARQIPVKLEADLAVGSVSLNLRGAPSS
jgi:hypothetical protein